MGVVNMLLNLDVGVVFCKEDFVIICECLERAVCVAKLNVLCVAKFRMWVWSCCLGD